MFNILHNNFVNCFIIVSKNKTFTIIEFLETEELFNLTNIVKSRIKKMGATFHFNNMRTVKSSSESKVK